MKELAEGVETCPNNSALTTIVPDCIDTPFIAAFLTSNNRKHPEAGCTE